MSSPQAKANNDRFQFIARGQERDEKSTVYLVSCLLAKEVIDYWLKGKKYPLDCSTALERLTTIETENLGKSEDISIPTYLKQSGSVNGDSLLEELELQLEDLCNRHPLNLKGGGLRLNAVDFIAKSLDIWYFGSEVRETEFVPCAVRLKWNRKSLRPKIIDKFEKSLLLLGQASVRSSLDFLFELANHIKEKEQEYGKKSEDYEEKQAECREIWQKSRTLLKKNPKQERDLTREWEIAKKTLRNIYKFKIETEVYRMAASILKDLDSDIQKYIRALKKSVNFLATIEQSFQLEEDLPVLIYHKSSKFIDLEVIKQKIEKICGHSLHNWGEFGGITEAMVREILLEELKPYAELSCAYWRERLIRELES